MNFWGEAFLIKSVFFPSVNPSIENKKDDSKDTTAQNDPILTVLPFLLGKKVAPDAHVFGEYSYKHIDYMMHNYVAWNCHEWALVRIITRCDLSPQFFCIDATLLCEVESDKI